MGNSDKYTHYTIFAKMTFVKGLKCALKRKSDFVREMNKMVSNTAMSETHSFTSVYFLF